MANNYDLVIIGGGLVGASLAVALANTSLRIAVVEAHPFESDSQPGYDERTVALTHSARQIYTGMGLWTEIARAGAEPIIDIHVTNQGHFGMTRLSHKDVGTDALGYVVPTRVIGQVLHQQMVDADNIHLLSPASAESMDIKNHQCQIQITCSEGTNIITSKLIVLADGGRSALSDQFHSEHKNYSQQALLSIVSTDAPHHGRAYERFTPEGPLALLPHSDQRFAVVWSCESEEIKQRMAYSDDEFVGSLQEAFGDRAGNFSMPSPRKSYPLIRSQVSSPIGDRMVIIGNAAHTVHPVAGQGFNLGLRDVANLADSIYQSMLGNQDIGSASLLQTYATGRKRDTMMVRKFTHGLIEIFSNTNPVLGVMRNIALCGFELVPPARRFVLKRTMGLAGRQSSLAKGLPLTSLEVIR